MSPSNNDSFILDALKDIKERLMRVENTVNDIQAEGCKQNCSKDVEELKNWRLKILGGCAALTFIISIGWTIAVTILK